MSRASAVVVVLAFAAMATPALGQENATTAARRVLLDQAQRARDGGDHARALQFATQAGAIQMTGSLRMFLAEEHRALGQLADALGAADACVRESERDASLPNRDTILRRCRTIVVAGNRHACARRMDGAVLCWGSNILGQLAVPAMTPDYRASAATVTGVSKAVEIGAGQTHTCAIRATGEILCWGADSSGQLGDSMRMTRSAGPVTVLGLP